MTLYADTPGERLDAFLTRSVPGLSRSAAQRLIEEGQVLRCGKPGKKNDKLNPGDPISYEIPEPKAVDIQPKDIPLDIVYEDEDLLVINKPKGLVVHPAAGHRTTPWSMGFSTPWETICPASTGNCAPASSTGLTRIPPGCWPWQKTTWLTRFWPPS